MRGPLLALCFAALSLGWLIFFGAGSHLPDWNATLLFLGAVALFYWTFRSGQTPPRLRRWHVLSLWALPAYAAFQLIPLPGALLEWFSPVRASIAQSLSAVTPSLSASAISVSAEASLAGFAGLLACLTTYSLLRDIGWRFVESAPWLPVTPVVALAVLQASIGLVQWIAAQSNAAVQGTFNGSVAFAAMLEIALPFPLVFAFISVRRHQSLEQPSSRPALWAAVAGGAALLLLLALFCAGSPASLFVTASSLFVLAALAIVPRLKTRQLRRYGAACVVALALLGLMIVLPPADFASSLAGLSAVQPADRLALWANAATLAGDFRWFGAGMGGFESLYPRYQGSADLVRVFDPSNGILTLLIAFGAAGFVIVIVALAGVVREGLMSVLHLPDEPRRLLAAALLASLVAALLRGALDGSLATPAIAIVFAWLAGLTQASGLD